MLFVCSSRCHVVHKIFKYMLFFFESKRESVRDREIELEMQPSEKFFYSYHEINLFSIKQ